MRNGATKVLKISPAWRFVTPMLVAAAMLLAMTSTSGCRSETEEQRAFAVPIPDATENPVRRDRPVRPSERPTFRVLDAGQTTPRTGTSPQNDADATVPVIVDPLQFHFDTFVVDTHIDTPIAILLGGVDIRERLTRGHVDLPRMAEGGLDAAFFSIWVNPREHEGDAAYHHARSIFMAVHALDWVSHAIVITPTAARMFRAVADGHIAIVFGVEGGHALGTADLDTALARLREFRALGARYMTITWSTDNPLGHASTGDHPELGLTDFGRVIIEEMEAIGLIVDVSHVSDQTFNDIMDVSTRPVMASHSSARALADHPRNMTDQMIVRVQDNGGVVCVNYYTHYIDTDYVEQRDAIAAAHPDEFTALVDRQLPYTDRGPAHRELARSFDPTLEPPTIGTIADHILYIVDLTGPETACLGSDFDGVSELPVGLDDVTFLPDLTLELLDRGLSRDHVAAILGGNVLRVMQENEPDLDELRLAERIAAEQMARDSSQLSVEISREGSGEATQPAEDSGSAEDDEEGAGSATRTDLGDTADPVDPLHPGDTADTVDNPEHVDPADQNNDDQTP